MEVGEAAREEGQRGERVAAEGVRVVEDDDGRGGGERAGGQVKAEADAGRAAAAGVADGAAGRGRGSGVAVVGGEWVQVHLVGPLLSCFALSLRPSGLVRLTRLLEVGLGWAECLESPFGNQNAYDFREFVHFL